MDGGARGPVAVIDRGPPPAARAPRALADFKGRSWAMKRVQYLRAELAEEMRTTLAKRMPSEAQLERWEGQLSRLDRVRELVDQTIPPPSLVEVLEEGQRHLESQSTED